MKQAWYREGFVYQIYPRSFADGNQDGIGDLVGIMEKVPYLKSLGIQIVWLSPVYASPNDDNGYDISDYRAIHPDFGTLDDMKQLIAVLHEAGIKLIMDLVVNHTSDEHRWFEASVQRDPKYDTYYHWSDTKKNWGSFFGGEAWTWHPIRKQYYLHLFSKKQPDLNWDNPEVRADVKDILRFWLDLGIDGFRCDVINLIAKADGLPKGKPSLILCGREHYLNHPKIHPYLQELRDEVFSHYDCFTVGETAFVTPDKALSYIAEDVRELDMVFQFEHQNADNYFIKWFRRKFRPLQLKRPLSKWQKGLQGKGWNTLYLENHDQPRSVSRFGSTLYPIESAKMLATMLFFQQGTPFLYQGQEIGMTNADFQSLDEYRDIETKNIYALGRKMFHWSHQRLMKKITYASRDNARTPMQWNDSLYAGFSTHEPWIHVNSNHSFLNVSAQENAEESLLTYYKKIISLRKKYDIIVYGDYQDIAFHHPRLYAYQRQLGQETLIVVCNFSAKPLKTGLLKTLDNAELILTNVVQNAPHVLAPYEARVYLKRG